MGQRVFVGDVQGCATELDELLEALDQRRECHEVWLVGDLVNRGPDSLGVLRRAIDRGLHAVLGNHDLHLLDVASGSRPLKPGDSFGDVLEAPDRDDLLAWLRSRPLVAQWDDVLCVHAGLHPRWEDPRAVAAPLERAIAAGRRVSDDPDLAFLVRVRHCDAGGRRPADDLDPGPGFRPWDAFYRGERTVAFGHWSMRGLVVGERVRGLDTGCVWGGRLSAWLSGSDRIVSVPARATHARPG